MANISCLHDLVFRARLRTQLKKLYRQIKQDVTIMQNIASINMKLALVVKSIDSLRPNMPQYGGFYNYKNKFREFFEINPVDMTVFQDPPNRVIRQEDGKIISPRTRSNNQYYAFYVAVIQDGNITMSSIHPNFATISDGMLDGDEIRILQELFPPDQPVDFDDFETEYIGQRDEHSLSGGLSDFGDLGDLGDLGDFEEFL